MGSAFGFSHVCPHRQTWRLHQMWLAPWDSALTSKMSGSVGNGASLSLINQSLIKSYFLLWLLRTCGALDGTDVMSCSALTTRLWCTFLHPRRPGLSIYPSWRGVGVFCEHRQRHISTVCTPILVVTFDNGLGNGPGLLFLFQDGRPIS